MAAGKVVFFRFLFNLFKVNIFSGFGFRLCFVAFGPVAVYAQAPVFFAVSFAGMKEKQPQNTEFVQHVKNQDHNEYQAEHNRPGLTVTGKPCAKLTT